MCVRVCACVCVCVCERDDLKAYMNTIKVCLRFDVGGVLEERNRH